MTQLLMGHHPNQQTRLVLTTTNVLAHGLHHRRSMSHACLNHSSNVAVVTVLLPQIP